MSAIGPGYSYPGIHQSKYIDTFIVINVKAKSQDTIPMVDPRGVEPPNYVAEARFNNRIRAHGKVAPFPGIKPIRRRFKKRSK